MAKALLLAWASPVSQETAVDFEEWYENTHIPQVREAIPSIGVVSRYMLTEPDSGDQNRFLAIYEMDEEDIPAAAGALGEGLGAGRIELSESLDMVNDPPQTQWYRRHPA